jgi:transcriptional regulator with XRE-family HTH domain
MGETRLQREARRREVETRRSIGRALRDMREDAGLTLAAVARAAGIDRSFLARIESGERAASVHTLTAIATVLGADLSVKAFPTTGPRIRDRFQAVMGEALLRALHTRWTGSPEVPVYRPARGVIDLVLSDSLSPAVVATELQSEIRRLEQQIRWHREKELSLPSADLGRFVANDDPPPTSRLLVLRSTRATRALAMTYEETLRAAYPARASDVVRALTSASGTWPGPGIAWMRLEGTRAELLDGPPRGVRLGR